MQVKNKCIFGLFSIIAAFFVSASVVQADENIQIDSNSANNKVDQKTKKKKHKTTVYSHNQDKSVGQYTKYYSWKKA